MSDYKGMNKQEIIGQIKIDTMLHGYHAGFLFAVIITVISFLCTFMIKKLPNLRLKSKHACVFLSIKIY